ncbi:hypothetical protein F2P56_030345 [Juglans regia]|uniref:Protein XRI1-like n=2 Tax=Juglans regia TaxID=51240 RepID=A0A2I4FA04_JUGRE|nr:protein XRI1-like [Juglans regia]KAF5449952.1 hypothetical protein F2P56_030345 [Juglans regia]
MGELHSLAYTHSGSLHSSSLGWDFHNLGVLDQDTMCLESDFSSGYLEDAFLEFRDRTKRRRMLSYTDDDHTDDGFKDLEQSQYWNSNSSWGMSENIYSLSQINSVDGFSDEPIIMSRINEDASLITDVQTPEDQAPEATDSSSSSYKQQPSTKSSDKEILFSTDPAGDSVKSAKKVITRVVYPFALVKPGGVEGDITLNDINERILMPPTRPVRHPVGDFACRPCVSPDGPGLSGKAVVALTRIHTQGRGTITIIRTKG